MPGVTAVLAGGAVLTAAGEVAAVKPALPLLVQFALVHAALWRGMIRV